MCRPGSAISLAVAERDDQALAEGRAGQGRRHRRAPRPPRRLCKVPGAAAQPQPAPAGAGPGLLSRCGDGALAGALWGCRGLAARQLASGIGSETCWPSYGWRLSPRQHPKPLRLPLAAASMCSRLGSFSCRAEQASRLAAPPGICASREHLLRLDGLCRLPWNNTSSKPVPLPPSCGAVSSVRRAGRAASAHVPADAVTAWLKPCLPARAPKLYASTLGGAAAAHGRLWQGAHVMSAIVNLPWLCAGEASLPRRRGGVLLGGGRRMREAACGQHFFIFRCPCVHRCAPARSGERPGLHLVRLDAVRRPCRACCCGAPANHGHAAAGTVDNDTLLHSIKADAQALGGYDVVLVARGHSAEQMLASIKVHAARRFRCMTHTRGCGTGRTEVAAPALHAARRAAGAVARPEAGRRVHRGGHQRKLRGEALWRQGHLCRVREERD